MPDRPELCRIAATTRRSLGVSRSTVSVLAGSVLIAGMLAGCAVPQPRGQGLLSRTIEPSTQRGYWLYLPKDYVQAMDNAAAPTVELRLWPLVMTFHGMNPWDSANAQAREWQEEADRYGFIVCAPELDTCNSFMEYPIRKVHTYVASDELATMAIMDHVFQKTNADPSRVLSTSWSAGGYLAHYIVNRHPERFRCIAVRQSNFSPAIMDSARAAEYSNITVAVFYTQNDFQACRKESEAAVEWYRENGFRDVRAGVFSGMGHERTPETAAAIFAESCGVTAKTAPSRLSRMQIMADIRPPASQPASRKDTVSDAGQKSENGTESRSLASRGPEGSPSLTASSAAP
jgi:poly(3-hydroxybutyrate) depolymerase